MAHAVGGVIGANNLTFTCETVGNSEWFDESKLKFNPKAKKYIIHGYGCNNNSMLFDDEKEMKETMKKLNDTWTGEIIGYEMKPICKVKKILKVEKI